VAHAAAHTAPANAERQMADLIFVALTVVVFAVIAACVKGVEKL
jgi:hypothetical protein